MRSEDARESRMAGDDDDYDHDDDDGMIHGFITQVVEGVAESGMNSGSDYEESDSDHSSSRRPRNPLLYPSPVLHPEWAKDTKSPVLSPSWPGNGTSAGGGGGLGAWTLDDDGPPPTPPGDAETEW